MKGYLILLGFLFCAFITEAQYDLMYTVSNEGKIVALPKANTQELTIPEVSYKTYIPASVKHIETKLDEFEIDFIAVSDERPMNMHVLSAAYKPFFNVYTPMMGNVSPMAFDFTEISVVLVSNNLTFLTVGSQHTWPGLGGLTTVNPMLSWRQEQLTITGGAFAGRYYTPFNHAPGFTGGFNLQAAYEITDWLTAKAWGQYAYYYGYDQDKTRIKETHNPHVLMNPFYKHTGVGGAFEFKISDGVGIGIGVDYQYNPSTRKMSPQYMLYPVFRNKNVTIGIW